MNNLIERAKQRDAEAFTQLMQSQMQNMYKTARALLSNEEDAADAISETILVLGKSWSSCRSCRISGRG